MASCRQCGTILPGDEEVCRLCWDEGYERFKAHPARHRGSIRHKLRVAPLTCALVAANVGLFAAMMLAGVNVARPTVEELVAWGAGYAPLTIGTGEWWRLVSMMFIHGGFLHLGFNMVCLLDLGELTERSLG